MSNCAKQHRYPKEHEEIFNPTTRHAQSASPPLEQRELGSPLFRGSCGCDSPRSTKAAAVPERVGGLPGLGGAAEHSPHCRGCSTMGWDVRGPPQHRGMGHKPACFWGCWWCWETSKWESRLEVHGVQGSGSHAKGEEEISSSQTWCSVLAAPGPVAQRKDLIHARGALQASQPHAYSCLLGWLQPQNWVGWG